MSIDRPESRPGGQDSGYLVAVVRRVVPLLVVLALWSYVGGINLRWLAVDTTPPSWDPAVHLSHSLYYYAYLTRMSFADAWAGLGATSHYYPPLVHFLGALCYLRYGLIQPTIPGFSSADVAVMTNLAMLLILVFSVYALAHRLYGPGAGVLAAFLVAVYPILAGESRLFLLDYPLTALTALSLALLVASNGLTHPFYVWPLGLAVGAAMWCKWSFAFIFVVPFLLALRVGWRRLRTGEDPLLTPVRFGFNLVVVVAAALLLAGPWYCSHLQATIRELLVSNQTWTVDNDPAVFSLAGLSYYLRVLLSSQIFLPCSLLAGFGVLCAVVQRHRLVDSDLVLGWLFGGALLLTLVPNKDPRFTMPLLPALAVLSTSWLAPPPAGRPGSPKWQRLRLILVGLVVLLGAQELQAVAWGVGRLPARVGLAAMPLLSDTAHLTTHPSQVAWPQAELARDIVSHTLPGGLVGVVPNTAHVNFLTLRYYVNRQQLPYLLDVDRRLRVMPAAHLAGGLAHPATAATLAADGYDTIVLMTGDQGAHAALAHQTLASLHAHWGEFAMHYRLVGSYRMPGPDGAVVTLYSRAE